MTQTYSFFEAIKLISEVEDVDTFNILSDLLITEKKRYPLVEIEVIYKCLSDKHKLLFYKSRIDIVNKKKL